MGTSYFFKGERRKADIKVFGIEYGMFVWSRNEIGC